MEDYVWYQEKRIITLFHVPCFMFHEYPLPVAISAIISNNKILLIQRVKDGFEGFWGLPGGKVRHEEHLSEAALREVLEETGLEAKVNEHLGYISEHQVENGDIHHVILHIFEVFPKTEKIIQRENEGRLQWFELERIEEIKNSLIPSDYLMIEKMVKKREKGYYNCVIETIDGKHILKKFE